MNSVKNNFIQQLQEILKWPSDQIYEDNIISTLNLILYKENIPLLYIEFVEEIDDYWSSEDIIEIFKYFSVPFMALTNGNEVMIFTFDFGYRTVIEDETNLLDFIARVNEAYKALDLFRRLDYEVITQDEFVQNYLNAYIISPVTTNKNRKRFAELTNALYFENYTSTNRSLPVKKIVDRGLEYLISKNASGGSFEGLHRVFEVELDSDVIVPSAISVLASAKTVNDKVHKNRTGSTYLNVLMQNTKNSAYKLQLNLDNYIHFQNDKFYIWHNGNRARMKSELVLNTTREIAIFLMEDNKVKLGTFLDNKSISSKSFSIFVENLISYAYCRHIADKRYR